MDVSSNPNYLKALQFIRENDLQALPAGKTVIDGDKLFVNIVDSQLRKPSEARLEVHDAYIDIQIPLSGDESFGIKARSECKKPVGEMDPVKDILFFDDPVEEIISAKAGEMVVFAPDTAHAPLIGSGSIHKAIFKVKL